MVELLWLDHFGSFKGVPNDHFVYQLILTTIKSYTVLIVLLVTLVTGLVFWKFAPKENQTVWRSTVSLTLAMMFLMWAITYLAQLHPLVVPRRSDLRPEFD
jgi:cytochrome b subunit of formate dehydrogenase